MRTRRTIAWGLTLAFIVSGAAAFSAAATAPVSLDDGFVTDHAGVLSAEELSSANDRLEQLSATTDASLFVVLVDDFTDPSDAQTWADTVAADNGLGTEQYLLAIATEGRNYYISADSDGPIDDARLDDIENAILPYLSSDDWPGAIEKATEEFATDPGANLLIGFLIVIVVVALVILVVILISRAREKARKKKRGAQPETPDPNDPFSTISDADLETQAGSALVQADDAITSSREELGFAIAQFGVDSTDTFTQVVEAAKVKVSEAFALKQQLDDEVPDSAEQRRAWHIRIIQLCAEADALLDDNIEAFEELRRLEAEAPVALERLRTRRAGLDAALTALPGALAALAQSYDAAALSTVADNPAQAQQRMLLADTEIADAARLIGEAKNGEAAFSIRTAEEAVVQAEQLAAAVASTGADLAAIEDQARVLIADLEADLVAAAQSPDPQGQLAPVVARTRAQLGEAQTILQSAARDPKRLLDTLDAANTQIDTALGEIRGAMERAQRAQQALAQRLLQAQGQISAANDYIATRRGAIGPTARTRLAEASAAFAEASAHQAGDPGRALDRATRAYNLASEAIATAQHEVAAWEGGGYSGGGGFGGGGFSGGGGSDLAGDILGGILGGIFSGGGGGSSRGGSSRGGWRSSGGSSSRGFRPSSFGGSRGGGGRSSGGSRGRSGGGRF